MGNCFAITRCLLCQPAQGTLDRTARRCYWHLLPTVTKTPFPSFQRGKKFWNILPRLKITSTYSVSPEPHKLKMLTAIDLPTSLCYKVTVVMSLRQNLLKHNSPPDALKHTHIHPHGDTDLRWSELPTFQKASAPFHFSPLHMNSTQRSWKSNCAWPYCLPMWRQTLMLGLLDKEVYGTGQMEALPEPQFYLAGNLCFS